MKVFNSQICTSREQSERLLALGLKKETADMKWLGCSDENGDIYYMLSDVPHHFRSTDIPAWSLHRLIEMMPNGLEMQDEEGETWEYLFHLSHVEVVYDVYLYERRFSEMANIYDNLISCIEWLIKEGYFNKEYLV